MSALNPNALSKFIGLLYVAPFTTGTPSFRRIASVRGLVNENSCEVTDSKADDTGTILSITKPGAAINATVLENADASLMDIVLPGTYSATAGTPVAVTSEAHGTGWTVGTPFKLTNKNGANTIVGSIVVEEDNIALALNTDYRSYVGDGINGELGYTYIVPLTAQTGVITADYSYTPNASKNFTFSKVQVEMPRLIVKVEAVSRTEVSPGVFVVKTRRILLSDARFDGSYNLDFLDIVEAGDLNGSEISFMLNDGGTFTLTDEINA